MTAFIKKNMSFNFVFLTYTNLEGEMCISMCDLLNLLFAF